MDFGAASALHQAWPSFTSPLLSPSQEAIAIIIPTAKFHTHHFWWPLSEIILIFRDERPSLAHLLTLLFVWAAFCNPGLNLRLTILLLVTLRVASWWTLFQVFLYFCCDAISAVLVLCLCCASCGCGCVVVFLQNTISSILLWCWVAVHLGGTWCATAIWDRISALSYWHSHLSQWVILLPFLLSSPVISASSALHCKLSPPSSPQSPPAPCPASQRESPWSTNWSKPWSVPPSHSNAPL